MSRRRPWLTIDTREHALVQRGALSVTPQSQIITLRTPLGIWRWVRPEALLVQRGDGLSRVPVHDPTRWLWLGFWLVAIVGAITLRPSAQENIKRRR